MGGFKNIFPPPSKFRLVGGEGNGERNEEDKSPEGERSPTKWLVGRDDGDWRKEVENEVNKDKDRKGTVRYGGRGAWKRGGREKGVIWSYKRFAFCTLPGRGRWPWRKSR